jgi:hypothetical protein
MINEIKTTERYDILNPSSTSLNVLVAYDNLCAGINAKDLCDRLTQHLRATCGLQLSFWSFSALQLPLLAQGMEAETAQADLLIVALNGEQAPPPCIQNWIRRWARRMHSDCSLLTAQLHGILKMDQEFSPAYECLKQIADDFGVNFLPQVIEPTSAVLDESLESIHKRAHMSSPVLDAILQLH